MKKLLLAPVVALGILAGSAPAFAQTTCYTPCVADTQQSAPSSGSGTGPSTQVRAVTQSRTLPVTGTDIGGLAVLGAGAVAAGVLLVRRSRPEVVEIS